MSMDRIRAAADRFQAATSQYLEARSRTEQKDCVDLTYLIDGCNGYGMVTLEEDQHGDIAVTACTKIGDDDADIWDMLYEDDWEACVNHIKNTLTAKTGSITEALSASYEAGGKAWDNPDVTLREIREG